MKLQRVDHFCRPLRVAAQNGLYLRLPAECGEVAGVQSLRILRALCPKPFLLIVCTRRIFTVTRRWRERVPRDTQMFQHMASYSQTITSLGGNIMVVTLGPFVVVTPPSALCCRRSEGSNHFCSTLMVAHETGLSHLTSTRSALWSLAYSL